MCLEPLIWSTLNLLKYTDVLSGVTEQLKQVLVVVPALPALLGAVVKVTTHKVPMFLHPVRVILVEEVYGCGGGGSSLIVYIICIAS